MTYNNWKFTKGEVKEIAEKAEKRSGMVHEMYKKFGKFLGIEI